jgi:SAM-dependent methyltransferase
MLLPIISNNNIEYIYNTYITKNNNDEYRKRYESLPFEKNNKNWKWEGKDLPRVISLLEFERYIQLYQFNIDNLLVFSGKNDPEIEYLEGRYKTLYNAEYVDDILKNDLHQLELPRQDYDFACLHQTLEHVYNPFQCLLNIKKHLIKGGYLYINVPVCNIPHCEPYHYYTGYTPMGLASVAYQCGFKILEMGQWGNLDYLVKLFKRQPCWPDYTQIDNPGINDFDTPIITWGLFQKQD